MVLVHVILDRVRPTVISVQWDILWSCSSTNNDEDIKFRVKYTSGSELKSLDQNAELHVTRIKVFLTGLTPYTNYSIQIAVVDEQGVVETNTDPIAIMTLEDG